MPFLILVIKTVAIQLLAVFGIFFLLGFILSKLQEWTQTRYYRTIGWKGILWTAWIGTPIHELSHFVVAKIFRHRVSDVTLFYPNERTGELGAVDHSFNPHSLYQRIGNFFIGMAPLLGGSIALTGLLWWFFPSGKEIFALLKQTPNSLEAALTLISQVGAIFGDTVNLRQWTFWLFLYISFCIASHLAPSRYDRRGMWRGFFWIVLVLLAVNSAALWLQHDLTATILRLPPTLAILTAMFTYAILVSFLHLAFATIFFLPWRKK